MTGSMNSFNTIALAVGLATVLAACSESGGQQDEGSEPEPVALSSDSGQEAVTSDMDIKKQIEYSIEDLSKRLDIDASTVSLSSAKTVNWSSGAKGCPKPGMMYTQALVPGVSILLLVGDTTYHYHAVTAGQPFFCPADQVQAPAKSSGMD